MKTRRSLLVLAGCLLAAALALSSTRAQEPSGLQAAAALESVLVDAIAKTEKSVVAIARVRADRQPNKEEESADFVPDEFASGVVIDAKGLILTNHHVLGEVKDSRYFVWSGRKRYAATVKAADPWLDLAVLKIDASDLIPLTLGQAADLKKGQIVIALGNPYAIARDGQPSASYGIVANLLRPAPRPKDASARGEGRESLHHYGNLIHTDCRLELGTSGGALINLKGEMVGLTTSLAALMGYERSGGFAIPVDDNFRRAVELLKAGRLPEYGFLGVAPDFLSDEERRQGHHGARVNLVLPGTPAAKAGIRESDVITEVDGKQVADDNELMRTLGGLAPGTTVSLTLQRGLSPSQPGRTIQTKAQLSKKRVDSARPGYAEFTDSPWRGMKVEYATASLAFRDQSRELDPDGCVAVVEVARESAAWKAGIRQGDFVSHIGKTRVTTPKQFYETAARQTGAVTLRLATALAEKAERTVAEEEPPAAPVQDKDANR